MPFAPAAASPPLEIRTRLVEQGGAEGGISSIGWPPHHTAARGRPHRQSVGLCHCPSLPPPLPPWARLGFSFVSLSAPDRSFHSLDQKRENHERQEGEEEGAVGHRVHVVVQDHPGMTLLPLLLLLLHCFDCLVDWKGTGEKREEAATDRFGRPLPSTLDSHFDWRRDHSTGCLVGYHWTGEIPFHPASGSGRVHVGPTIDGTDRFWRVARDGHPLHENPFEKGTPTRWTWPRWQTSTPPWTHASHTAVVSWV